MQPDEDFLLDALTLDDLARRIREAAKQKDERRRTAQLLGWYSAITEPRSGLIWGVNPRQLEQSGWGVIYTAEDAPLLDKLRPLLDRRRKQAGAEKACRYRELVFDPKEDKTRFFKRCGFTPGEVRPDKAPYYLLIVGDPEKIPYSFQYELDIPHAVGRIHFQTEQAYADYAASVVAFEEQGRTHRRRMALVGVRNGADHPTNLSYRQLVLPLAESLKVAHPNWQVIVQEGMQARRDAIVEQLSGPEHPSLLFTASHGAELKYGHPLQLRRQGALVCQDWDASPVDGAELPESCLLTGEEPALQGGLHGLLGFFFGCFTAGTPQNSEYSFVMGREPPALAPHSFVSALSQNLLGRPDGALALFGHVERANSSAFSWLQVEHSMQHFVELFHRLLHGFPIGHATEPFQALQAEIAGSLHDCMERYFQSSKLDSINGAQLRQLWSAHNNIRGFVLVGDPAVRLQLND